MKHFDESEFYCQCGECGLDWEYMQPDFLEMLDDARQQAGVPFVITSSIRCEDHNRDEGGAIDSAHLTGYAVDIRVHGSRERFMVIKGALAAGFTRIGIAKAFVHMDCSPDHDSQVAWVYS